METIIASLTRETKAPAPLVIATAQLHKLGGNARPYFSLTGAEYPRRWKNPAEHDPICCGQMGEQLTGIWPDLGSIDALHLSDDRGVPMHAVENGLYWLGFTEWVRWDQTQDRYGRPQVPREVVARHFRITEDEATDLHHLITAVRPTTPAEMPTKPATTDPQAMRAARLEALAAWVDTQRPRWDAEARAALTVMGKACRVLNPDGVTMYAGNADECWLYVQSHQGQSVHWATTEGGWAIEDLTTAVEIDGAWDRSGVTA